MRIALGQTNIIWKNKKANMEKCIDMIKKASKEKSDIIIFPEMSLTGFTMNTDTMADNFENSETIKGIIEKLSDYLTKQSKVTLYMQKK